MIISKYILAGVLAWFIAQLTKYVLVTIKNKKLDHVNRLYLSGGMPSAHSATTVAMLTTIAIIDGIETPLFAVASLMTSIVIYDAIMVRRSSGEQGVALLKFMKEQKSHVDAPFVALGHNWLEALAGSFLGLIIGISVAS